MSDAIGRTKGENTIHGVSRVSMGRQATSEEIAYGILFLASDESSYVTGAKIVINGGVTAQ